MIKIIFGGSFDPIHNGHINMALNAQKSLKGDVLFVPAPISVWKDNSVSAEHKIKMLEIAIKDIPGFYIDTYEIDSGNKTNYSIDTVRHFKNKFPNDELYFLIGTDQVNKFHLWKDADELAKLAKIAYFVRPDVKIENDNHQKFDMIKIEGPGIVAASSDIRQLINTEINPEVLLYIIEHKLYVISGLTKYIDEKRLNHSIEVAKLSYQIAKKNGVEKPIRALIAGLLHDIGKAKDKLLLEKTIEEEFTEYKELPLPVLHQFYGYKIAKKVFGIVDETILNAIKYHATGNTNMDELAMIVYAADKIEPTRNFDSTDLIEAMMVGVESGFKTVLKANKEYLEQSNKDFNNALTSNCFEQYLK